MQMFAFLLLVSVSLWAQQSDKGGSDSAAGPEGPEEVLGPEHRDPLMSCSDLAESLGVQCTYCHVQGDFAADTNPKKDIARKMISMVRLIDTSYFRSSAGVFPAGYWLRWILLARAIGETRSRETKAPVKFYNRG